MSIIIQKKAKPTLKPPEFKCDNGLHEKLNKFEMLQHINQHSTTCFIGKPRSGKTSLVCSLFSNRDILKKVFHKIYLFQPAESGQSLKNNIFDCLPENQIYHELTLETLKDCYDTIKGLDKKENKCIVMDDMAAFLKKKELINMFKDLCYNRRHHSVSIFFLVQTYYSIPKEIRRIFNNIFVFKTSKMEFQVIMEEQFELDDKYILPLLKSVYNQQYNYLMLNNDTQKMYKNFDEIIIKEDENDEEN